MTRLVVTGGDGFLGWHLRVLARSLGMADPVLVGRGDWGRATAACDGADRVVHLAGMNRGAPAAVAAGNIGAARALAAALRVCATPPKVVVFANSVQASGAGAYGDSKATAADILSEATRWSGSSFVDARLANLFGEHGRPHYNSVVATFSRVLIDGGTPEVLEPDRPLDLQHATDAAALLLGTATPAATPVRRTVRELAGRLSHFAAVYRDGDLPDLADRFDVRLFNSYRSHAAPRRVALRRREDHRGDLVETVRAHGGGGQAFCSTTRPGRTRGEHYHLAKVERFVVLRGTAEIRLRRLLHSTITRIRVGGDRPVAVDMPTMWVHSITNTGDADLVTQFWSHDLFDPAHPDTYAEAVGG